MAVPDRIRWAVEQLGARASERLLEIGCGTGHALGIIGARLAAGQVTGIDRSALQVRRARERNADLIARGRVRVEHVSLADAPAALGKTAQFDKVFATNVNAFWTTPEPALKAVAMLLARRGRLYLVYEPPSRARLQALRERLPLVLTAHGFTVADIRVAASSTAPVVCLVSSPHTNARSTS